MSRVLSQLLWYTTFGWICLPEDIKNSDSMYISNVSKLKTLLLKNFFQFNFVRFLGANFSFLGYPACD